MKTSRICENGHQFFKNSDCPVCERAKDQDRGFLSLLSNPARSALLHEGIDTLEKLSTYTEKEILKLHGIGKASLPVFRKSLQEQGLGFKPDVKKKR